MKHIAILAALAALACTPEQLAQAQDASNKRDTICAFVKAWSGSNPELGKAADLCDAGAELKDIAAAYAGCYEVEQ